MHIPRKPGDRIEVDWAGDKLYIVDRDTGEAIPVYLFVGVLPFSMYAYAEGCLRMDMENWIHVHVAYAAAKLQSNRSSPTPRPLKSDTLSAGPTVGVVSVETGLFVSLHAA